MKKALSLILLLVMVISVFGLTACEFIKFPNYPNNPDNPDNPNNPNNPNNPDNPDNSEDGEKTYVTYTDIMDLGSYIGYGINIIDASAINRDNVEIHNPIFDLDKLKDERILKETARGSIFDYIDGKDIQEFTSKLSKSDSVSSGKNASAKGKIYGVNAEASASFSNGLKTAFTRSATEITNEHFMRILAENKSQYLTLQSDESDYTKLLSKFFKDDLYDLSPEKLFAKYGTHLLRSVVMGGYINLDYSMYSTNTEVSEETFRGVTGEFKTQASVGFGDYGASAGSDTSVEKNYNFGTIASKENISFDRKVTVVGGTFEGIVDEATLFAQYATWQKSLDTDPVLIGISTDKSLFPIWELIDPNDEENKKTYDWVDKDGKKQTGTRVDQLKGYFEKYGLESYEALCANYDRNTIHIDSFEDLEKISEKPDGTYSLHSDINCGGTTWEPINEFTGTIEGNGHKIYNFHISATKEFSGSAAIGFVGTNKGTINNLIIGNYDNAVDDKGNIIDKYFGDYFVQYNFLLTENDHKQEDSSFRLGGIAGKNEDEGTINGCKVVGASICVTFNSKCYYLNVGAIEEISYLYIGGISGTSSGKISNSQVYDCHIEGGMTTEADTRIGNRGWLGGICGYSTNEIQFCSTVECTLKLDVRGDGGFLKKASPRARVGGIVAYQEGKTLNMCLSSNNKIEVYVSDGQNTEPTINVGIVAGKLQDSQAVNCYAVVPANSSAIQITTTNTKDNPTYNNDMRGDGKEEGWTPYSKESALPSYIKDLLPDA